MITSMIAELKQLDSHCKRFTFISHKKLLLSILRIQRSALSFYESPFEKIKKMDKFNMLCLNDYRVAILCLNSTLLLQESS